MLFVWGRFVHRHRWLVLACSVLLLGTSLAGLVDGGQLSSASFDNVGMPSQRAQRLMQQELGAGRSSSAAAPPTRQAATGTPVDTAQAARTRSQSGSTFMLLLTDHGCSMPSAACRAAVADSVAPLANDPRVLTVSTPYSGRQLAPSMISKGGHTALVDVRVRDSVDVAAHYYPQLVSEVRNAATPGLSVQGTGNVEIAHEFDVQLNHDLHQAEAISLPVSLLLLVLIFGSLVAGLLPLGSGSLAVAAGSGITLLLARHFEVSQYALDIVSLIGLGVSIDYSLFITSRFREELQGGQGAEEALSTALGCAGRAVAFSGITVAVGLCSLLFFPGTYATSIGLCGALTVLAAVIFALTFLPALLAILGPRIGHVQVRRGGRRGGGGGFWRGLAIRVMRRPIVFLVPTMALLVLAGMPFLHLRMAAADFHQLPPNDAARLSYNALSEDFPNQAFTLVSVVVDYPSGNPLTAQRVGDLYDLSRRAATIDGVNRVTGPLESEPGMSRAGYQQLLSKPRDELPPSVRDTLTASVGRQIVVMSVISQSDINSTTAQHIVQALRDEHVSGGRVMVTGQTALNMDAVAYILQRAPYAVAFVVGLSLILLFLLTGSVVLPIKAILSNLVSICASFGALVWIFQQGHLQHLLNFTPQPIDPSILVLLFAAVFGLSMDYEVLLVSRIQEKYRETGNNAYAGVAGLQHSGGLITGAAAIMITVFSAFATADMVFIKSIGLGLAIAIGIDATLVRAIVVPSVMRLMGSVNWWAPRPLRRFHEHAGGAPGGAHDQVDAKTRPAA